MPAKAGIQGWSRAERAVMDSRFRGNDDNCFAEFFIDLLRQDASWAQTVSAVRDTDDRSPTELPAKVYGLGSVLGAPLSGYAVNPPSIVRLAPVT